MKSKIQLYSSNPPKKKACFRLPASCFLSPPLKDTHHKRFQNIALTCLQRAKGPSRTDHVAFSPLQNTEPFASQRHQVALDVGPRMAAEPPPPPPPLDDAGWEIPAKRVQPKRHGKGRQFRETGHFLVENYNNFILRGGITT